MSTILEAKDNGLDPTNLITWLDISAHLLTNIADP